MCPSLIGHLASVDVKQHESKPLPGSVCVRACVRACVRVCVCVVFGGYLYYLTYMSMKHGQSVANIKPETWRGGGGQRQRQRETATETQADRHTESAKNENA